MVQLNFDANGVDPNVGFEPVPEGWYNVAVSESEMKPTKDGLGAFLLLKCGIIDGQFAGKFIFIRLNLQNKNQQAVDIAYGELSAIAHCTGVMQVADSSQIHGIPFQVRVIVSNDPQYGPGNDVKGYKDAAGNEPGKAPTTGGAPANFGGTAAPAQAGAPAAFGGAPAAGQPAAGQPAAPAQAGWGNQPAAPATEAPATAAQPAAGGFDPATGQPLQPAAPAATGGFDPNTGQPLNPGFAPGQPTQPAAAEPAAPAGNAGWTQPAAGGAPATGAAPWGGGAPAT